MAKGKSWIALIFVFVMLGLLCMVGVSAISNLKENFDLSLVYMPVVHSKIEISDAEEGTYTTIYNSREQFVNNSFVTETSSMFDNGLFYGIEIELNLIAYSNSVYFKITNLETKNISAYISAINSSDEVAGKSLIHDLITDNNNLMYINAVNSELTYSISLGFTKEIQKTGPSAIIYSNIYYCENMPFDTILTLTGGGSIQIKSIEVKDVLLSSYDYQYNAETGKLFIPSYKVDGQVYVELDIQYLITLDKDGGTGGTDYITTTYNAEMQAITPPAKDGVIFAGYYSGTNGSGTKYYNSDGSSVKNWDMQEDKTLYASWLDYDLKYVTKSSGTAVFFDSTEIVTSGNTFYVSDIDGLLTFAGIVNGTANSGIGFTSAIANTMTGAIIMLIDDIDYNPNISFGINMTNGSAVITGGTPQNWTSIGKSNTFYGTFDGNGHVISGLYKDGLFGKVGNNVTIRNLGIENSYITSNQATNLGMIVGEGSGTVTIENCYNTGHVAASNSAPRTQAGIAGILDIGSIVRNCYNSGNIYGKVSDWMGGGGWGIGTAGIVGSIRQSSIINCYNIGEIYGINHVGGIVGISTSWDPSNLGIIKNCYNMGTVKGSSDVGGIAATSHNGSTISCFNDAIVQGGTMIGGILGSTSGTNNMEACYNIGNVGVSGGAIRTGGFVGYNGFGASLTISNSFFKGTVNGIIASDSNCVGETHGSTTKTNCNSTSITRSGIITVLNNYVINTLGTTYYKQWQDISGGPYLIY